MTAKYMSIVQGIIDLAKPEFEEIGRLDQETLEAIINDRDDLNSERADDLYRKIETLTAKEREAELNNRDRRLLKKFEKQKEELDQTGRIHAWIEEDISLAIEEKIEQEEAEEDARRLREKAVKKAKQVEQPVAVAPPSPKKPVEEKPVFEKVEEVADDDSNSYVKVSKEDIAGYVPSDKDSDDSDASSDDDDDEDDYYSDFESKKKQDKKKKANKVKLQKQAEEEEKATAHIKDGERYYENIVKKVEQLKGKGKPIYTLAAKKLYMKGKGKAAEMKGSSGGKGTGKGSVVADIGKGVMQDDEESDVSDDEEEEEAKYDEWGDLIVDENAPPKKPKKQKQKKADGLEMFPNSSAGFIPPEYDIPQDAAVLACPVCTFHNHIQNENCEICGASLEPPSKDEPNSGPSRYIKEQQQAFKEQVKASKGKGKKVEAFERSVVIDGAGKIKVVTKTEEEVKNEKLAYKKKQIEEYVDDDDISDEEDDFFRRARNLNDAKKTNVNTDFTSQFTGNGKLNPAAEAAIKEKNERAKRLEEERLEKEEKAARKQAKKIEKEREERRKQEEELAALAEQAAKDAKANKPKKEKLKPAVKGQEGSNW